MKGILIIPLAGFGSRFLESGYIKPKQLLDLNGKTCIERTLESISNLNEFKVISYVRNPLVAEFLSAYLNANKIENIVISGVATSSPVETLQKCIDKLSEAEKFLPLFVHTMDIAFAAQLEINLNIHLGTYVFKANSPNYSYCKFDENNYLLEVAEKRIISEFANVGLYGIGSANFAQPFIDEVIDSYKYKSSEASIVDIYASMLAKNSIIYKFDIDGVYIFGTPREYEFCKKHIYNYKGCNKAIVFSDHSGVKVKNKIIKHLQDLNFKVVEIAFDENHSFDYDYSDLAFKACNQLNVEPAYVFAACRSGQGVNISMNKMSGMISTLIYNRESFSLAISHNCSTIFCFPEAVWENKKINFIGSVLKEAYFEGGRHMNRLLNIKNI